MHHAAESRPLERAVRRYGGRPGGRARRTAPAGAGEQGVGPPPGARRPRRQPSCQSARAGGPRPPSGGAPPRCPDRGRRPRRRRMLQIPRRTTDLPSLDRGRPRASKDCSQCLVPAAGPAHVAAAVRAAAAGSRALRSTVAVAAARELRRARTRYSPRCSPPRLSRAAWPLAASPWQHPRPRSTCYRSSSHWSACGCRPSRR
mmetsp:Transcript_15204/g.63183  ORF Transcript_15204/g.63183 Transcript_15204/m.63183 type:complete len:202 (-) Transcript_15204:451-1056(-)